MPTYVYECAKCGDEFELWQSFSDDPLKRHRGGCGGKVTKVIQPAGIVLKGSGFYKNDSRSGAKKAKPEKSDNGSAAGGESTSTPKADASSASSNGSGTSKSDSSSKPATTTGAASK